MDKEEMIKAIEQMTVLELSDLVKALEEKFGVSAAVAMAPAAQAPAATAVAAPVEEQTEFTVTLKDFGANKINVIKVVRELTGLGLKEAKDLVEAAPRAVVEGLDEPAAAAVKRRLQDAGAQASVVGVLA